MASRRKRSLRGLGASAEEHGEERAKAEKRALSYLNDADENAAKGKCSLAIRDLMKAGMYVGMFKAHRQSGGSGDGRWSMEALEDYLGSAGVRVVSECSVDTAPRRVAVSDLGRSSRRRRK